MAIGFAFKFLELVFFSEKQINGREFQGGNYEKKKTVGVEVGGCI